MIRLLRTTLRLGVLGGVGYGVWKRVWGRRPADWWAESWVSTGKPGATRPAAAPMVPTPAPGETAPPAATGSNGEAVAAGDTSGSPGSDESAGGNGRVAGGPAGSQAPGPTRPATARSSRPSRTGPARRTPTGKAVEPPGERRWVAANDGVCPQSHPVKAKLSSRIFHLPGDRNYSRTHADRCYPDEQSAVADGLRPPLR
jgi:hypothetical protein